MVKSVTETYDVSFPEVKWIEIKTLPEMEYPETCLVLIS